MEPLWVISSNRRFRRLKRGVESTFRAAPAAAAGKILLHLNRLWTRIQIDPASFVTFLDRLFRRGLCPGCRRSVGARVAGGEPDPRCCATFSFSNSF
jgi:hypothetical protein